MDPRRVLAAIALLGLSATTVPAESTSFRFRVGDRSLVLRRQALQGGGEIVHVDLEGLEPKLWQDQPGLPRIPYTERRVALPLGARISGIDATPGTATTYEGVSLVGWTEPEQPSAERDPVLPGNPADPATGEIPYYPHPTSVPPDASIARAPAWPAREQVRLVGTEERAGFQIATIRIHPVQWYPSAETLRFTPSIDVTIVHEGGSLPAPRRSYRTAMDLRETRLLVANADLIPGYTDSYPLVPADLDAWYLIITDNHAWDAATITRGSALSGDMVGELTRLADWKTEKGVQAKVVTISDIVDGRYGNFRTGARDLQEVLRNFLKHAYAEFGTYWVLLGGDVSVVPARYVAMEHGSDDSYFARETNTKPEEGKCYWDETTDTVRIHTRGNVTATTAILTADTGAAFRKVASPSAAQPGWAYATDDGYGTISPTVTNHVILRGSLADTQNKDFYAAASTNSIPTDLYYASLIGPDYGLTGKHDWDKNGNEVYGQFHGETSIDGVDWQSDVALGRAPIESGAEAKTFVDKVLAYELHDGVDSGFSHTLLLGSANWSSSPLVQPGADPVPPEKTYYHAAGSTTALLHFEGAPESEDDLRLVAYDAPGDWWLVPYDRNASAQSLGWYYCTDATYSTISEYVYSANTITLRIPIRTAFVKVRGPADQLQPAKYLFDPVAMDRSAREKEELKVQFRGDFPEIDQRKRLYVDLLDVPDYPAPDLFELSSALMQAELSAGYNIVTLSGHGNSGGCCGVNSTIASQLTNGPRAGILYANSCLTGKFDAEDCFGEALIKRSGGGAVAYVGYSRFGWVKAGGSFENSFWRSMAEDRHLGSMHNSKALLANSTNGRWSNYALNLLGDPEMEVWVEPPLEFHPDLPIEVAPDLPFWTLSVGEILARVCVRDRMGRAQIRYTGEAGSVAFSTRSFEPGDTLLVTITKTGFLPYQQTVRMGGGSGFIRCDANQDGLLDVSDAIFTLGALFLGTSTIECDDAADSNDDGAVDISDALTTLAYLFLGGTLPAGTTPGVPQEDPTPDGLGCRGTGG